MFDEFEKCFEGEKDKFNFIKDFKKALFFVENGSVDALMIIIEAKKDHDTEALVRISQNILENLSYVSVDNLKFNQASSKIYSILNLDANESLFFALDSILNLSNNSATKVILTTAQVFNSLEFQMQSQDTISRLKKLTICKIFMS